MRRTQTSVPGRENCGSSASLLMNKSAFVISALVRGGRVRFDAHPSIDAGIEPKSLRPKPAPSLICGYEGRVPY